MSIQEKSKIEYMSRINRVMDYIDQHLDEPLELKCVAEVANFSPCHFHRIFTFLIGETPVDYIQRLRIEKAACKLYQGNTASISDIAYSCGFSTASLFSRIFKKVFGLTPSQFRETQKPVYTQNGILFSKNGQKISKNRTQTWASDAQLCCIEFNRSYFMEAKIVIKEMPAMKAIYCRHIGSFQQIVRAYEKLIKWAEPRGLYSPNVTKTATVTHDDPSVTALDRVRQSACLIVDGDVKGEGEIGNLIIPGGKYVIGHFELRTEDFEKAWNTMCKWFTESGYQQAEGSPYELFHNSHGTHPENKHIVDICIPIKPLVPRNM